jgi:hypothetical protein
MTNTSRPIATARLSTLARLNRLASRQASTNVSPSCAYANSSSAMPKVLQMYLVTWSPFVS